MRCQLINQNIITAMKRISSNNPILLLLVSLILSAGIIHWHSVGNVPFCLDSPVCRFDMEPTGTIKKLYFGYPLSYKITSTFYPINNDANKPNYAGFAQASAEPQKFTVINIFINVLFWFALLRLITALIPTNTATFKKTETS